MNLNYLDKTKTFTFIFSTVQRAADCKGTLLGVPELIVGGTFANLQSCDLFMLAPVSFVAANNGKISKSVPPFYFLLIPFWAVNKWAAISSHTVIPLCLF